MFPTARAQGSRLKAQGSRNRSALQPRNATQKRCELKFLCKVKRLSVVTSSCELRPSQTPSVCPCRFTCLTRVHSYGIVRNRRAIRSSSSAQERGRFDCVQHC